MYLFLSSQDLKTLDLCLLDQSVIHIQAHLETTPESFLFSLDEQLTQWGTNLSQMQGVVVVSGPGSFTSSRLSVTIANAIAFRYTLPILAIANPERLPIETLVQTIDFSQLSHSFAQPVYDRPPFIT